MTKFKPNVKAMLVIHSAFLYAQILFAITIYFVTNKNEACFDEATSRIIETVVTLFTVVSVLTAFTLFKKKVQILKDDVAMNAVEKIEQYKVFSIVKFSLLEASCLLAVLAYFLTTNINFMIVAAILVLIFAAQRPTLPLIIHHLAVTREDIMD
jgi:hypothetical protein